jgi:hypothetical protein
MTLTETRPTAKTASGRAAATPAVELKPPGKRMRGPEVVVGVLVTVVFALGAVLWHLSSIEKVPALVVASAVKRGDVVEANDIRIVYVSSDSAVARLEPSETSRVVGRIALVDLAEGTIVTPSVVAEASVVSPGDGVVGLSLEPGAYPAKGLAPGDHVTVVRSADVAALDAKPVVVATNAVVFAVEELASDRLMVSVHASAADAEAVASVAGAGGLRLVLVGS